MDPWYQQPGVVATVAYTVLTAFIAWYMRRQTSLQKQLTNIQIFYSFVKRMEATRVDRAKLRAYVQQQRAAGQPITMPLPPDVDEAANRVCREYDILGLLDRHGLIDRRLVDQFYSVPLALLHKDILATYLNYIRDASRRGPTHFWELASFAERVRPEFDRYYRHSPKNECDDA
jgi:hypothetical protein